MASGVYNIVISLAAMQLAKKIDFEDPNNLFMVRVAYVSVQVIIMAVYYYTSIVIKRKNDQTVLKYGQSMHLCTHSPPLSILY